MCRAEGITKAYFLFSAVLAALKSLKYCVIAFAASLCSLMVGPLFAGLQERQERVNGPVAGRLACSAQPWPCQIAEMQNTAFSAVRNEGIGDMKGLRSAR